MKKNLTVGMPLAVPTQKRPPDKYASHPYPILVDEDAYTASIEVLDAGMKEGTGIKPSRILPSKYASA